MNLTEAQKLCVDALSICTVLSTLALWLPPLAALVSFIWGCIRIYETKTVQSWLRKRKRENQEVFGDEGA
jgi:hypothetical protein